MTPAEGAAPARTALVGNPSDGYGGAVLSVVLPQIGARARATVGRNSTSHPPSPLVDAVVRRFTATYAAPRSTVEWATSVPEGVGLGGSSAIAIAVIRALCALHRVELAPDQVAALALAVEREDLGIAGGRQDQVAEAYGGLTLTDFSAERVERLDPTLLPPLVVAWRDDCSEHSGIVHSDLRRRHHEGDPVILRAIEELTALAFAAGDALRAGDLDGFARCVDATFDLRARMLALDARHVAMVDCARGAGAAANYTGSGGAIVATCHDGEHQRSVMDALDEHGCGVLAPALADAQQ